MRQMIQGKNDIILTRPVMLLEREAESSHLKNRSRAWEHIEPAFRIAGGVNRVYLLALMFLMALSGSCPNYLGREVLANNGKLPSANTVHSGLGRFIRPYPPAAADKLYGACRSVAAINKAS